MKKKIIIIALVAVVLSLSTLFTPGIEAKSEREKLQERIKELQKKQAEASDAVKKAEKDLKNVRSDINKISDEINSLDQQLAELEDRIAKKELEISITEDQALEAARLLDEAIARVNERDALLKTRVRAMYETGDVSYLEALLDSSSIGDFLTRVDMMEKIVDSDKSILAAHIADKEEIEARKAEVEALLAQLKNDYVVLNENKQELESLYKQKTTFIASLKDMEEDLQAEIEKQDEEFRKLAKELSEANQKLKKLEFNGEFTWPVPDSYKITSNFGYRTDPITGKKQATHTGTDIGAPQGTKIVAAAAGEVILAKYYGTYGNCIMIDHGGGVVTLYGHIKNGGIKVKVGDMVKQGQKIAEVGSTGRSTGPHLHFSVIKDGEYVDPMKYLKGK